MAAAVPAKWVSKLSWIGGYRGRDPERAMVDKSEFRLAENALRNGSFAQGASLNGLTHLFPKRQRIDIQNASIMVPPWLEPPSR